jgi:ABC-type Na+ efflux pump permease subunit
VGIGKASLKDDLMALDKKRIKRFLRKRDRLLTVIGAIIVFVMFMVREGAREHLKEVADTVAAAESSYALSETIESAVDADVNLEFKEAAKAVIQETNNPAVLFNRRAAYARIMAKTLPLAPRYLIRLQYSLKELADVADVLKDADGLKSHVREESRLLKVLEDDYDKLPRMTVEEMHDSKNEEKATEAIQGFITMSGTFMTFTLNLDPLHHDVLAEAERQKQQAETWFKWCTWGSYVLYSIGWALGLVGKIFGVKTGGGD